jgi:hypothetical protein
MQDDTEVGDVLVADFNKYTWGRWRIRFEPGMVPQDLESCFDWGYYQRGGRIPEFFLFTKHGACHWLVNFNLRLAILAAPKRPWQILTSDNHSTVWDGGKALFDMNYLAAGIPAAEAFSMAANGKNAEILAPGVYMKVSMAEHWRAEQRRRDREQAAFLAQVEECKSLGMTKEEAQAFAINKTYVEA